MTATVQQLLERLRAQAQNASDGPISLTQADARELMTEVDRLTVALGSIAYAQPGDVPRNIATVALQGAEADHTTFCVGGYGKERFGLAWNADAHTWVTDDTFTRYTEKKARQVIDSNLGAIQVVMTVAELNHFRKAVALRQASAPSEPVVVTITDEEIEGDLCIVLRHGNRTFAFVHGDSRGRRDSRERRSAIESALAEAARIPNARIDDQTDESAENMSPEIPG